MRVRQVTPKKGRKLPSGSLTLYVMNSREAGTCWLSDCCRELIRKWVVYGEGIAGLLQLFPTSQEPERRVSQHAPLVQFHVAFAVR